MERFFKALFDSPNLMESFKKQKTSMDIYRLAKPYIEDMSFEEFTKEMLGLTEVIDSSDDNSLSVNSLEVVSAGLIKNSSEIKDKIIDIFSSK